MGTDIWHWVLGGFFFGIGFALATWLIGKILR